MPYRGRGHTVVTTPTFDRQARDAGLSEDEVTAIVCWIAESPALGDVIPGTGGARKVRFARRGAGKSGGYRTIHYFAGQMLPVFLLALVDKGARANLSKAERNELASVLPKIAETYRSGIGSRMKRSRR